MTQDLRNLGLSWNSLSPEDPSGLEHRLLDQTRFHASFGFPLKIKHFMLQEKEQVFGGFFICLKYFWPQL